MKNNKALKNMDVDLDTLQLFNSEEFNKFMSNLLNQDTLNSKTRDEVQKKVEQLFVFVQKNIIGKKIRQKRLYLCMTERIATQRHGI